MALIHLDFVDLILRDNRAEGVFLRNNGPQVSLLAPVPPDCISEAIEIYVNCEEKRRNCGQDIFRLEHGGATYRVTAESRTVNERTTFALRKCPKEVPNLESVGWPPVLTEKLLNPNLRGLIMVTGPMGVGKTYAIGAIIAEWLNRYGGYARTLEDPVELPMDGLYSRSGVLGMCVQSEVAQCETGYADALKKVVRESPDIILGGEVRDRHGAAELLRAGLNGHLLFTTQHAENVKGALDRMLSYAKCAYGEETPALMAEAITAIIHIKDASRRAQVLFLKDEGGVVHSARSVIAAGKFDQLRTDMTRQENGLQRGGDSAVFGTPG